MTDREAAVRVAATDGEPAMARVVGVPPSDLPRTEAPNPASANLDELPTAEILSIMNAEDRLVAAAVAAELDSVASAVDAIAGRLSRGGRLVYLGAGTSGRLALMEAAEAGPTFAVPDGVVIGVIAGDAAAERRPREEAEDDDEAGAAAVRSLALGERDALVGLSASGRTAFVLGAIEEAARRGALTIGVACDDPTPLGERAAIAIHPIVGPEIIAGSTRLKAGTAQKLVVNMLTTAAMVRLGKVHGNLMVDVRATNRKLRTRARRIVERVSGRDGSEVDDALEAAGWSARVAIVMLRCGISADEARALLARTSRLADALERCRDD